MANTFSLPDLIVSASRIINNSISPNLFYPIDIESAKDRPVVMFSCETPQQGFKNIFFPMPVGVTVGDSIEYNNSDLNFAGMATLGALNAGMKAEDIKSGFLNAAASGANSLGQAIPKNLNEAMSETARVARMAGKNLPDSVSSAITLASQMTSAKNTVTMPTGVPIRSHSYTFKLVARSQKEAQMIKDIQFAFRSGLYPQPVPGSETARLQFPPKWKIRYKSLPTLNDLEHLPQPYETFLQTMTTNFNSGSTMWRNDGAPLEVDITLSFIETKSLTAVDINLLQGQTPNGAGGNNMFPNLLKKGVTSLVGKDAANVVNNLLFGGVSGKPQNGLTGNSSPGLGNSSQNLNLGGLAGDVMSKIKKLF